MFVLSHSNSLRLFSCATRYSKQVMDTIIAGQQFEATAAKEYEAKGIKIATPLTDKLEIFQEIGQRPLPIGTQNLLCLPYSRDIVG